MELTWWGTASFRISSGNNTILIDPFLSRNAAAKPKQYQSAYDVNQAEIIFISHGHFDHLMDVPEIANANKSTIYCSKDVCTTLVSKGVKAEKIKEIAVDGFKVNFQDSFAQGFFSEHVEFDRKLVFKTMLRSKLDILKFFKYSRQYPAGQVLSWRLSIEGKIIHFFGTAGSTAEEMEKLASRPTDILLVPLQGHSDICEMALEYVHVMQPSIVIPHHYDDFYPPLSTTIDIDPFISSVKRECPKTEVKVLELNETILL